MFITYCGCVSAITMNMVKMKYQVDMEEEIKKLREYDLATEKIRIGTDLVKDDGEYIVLAKHKGRSSKGDQDGDKEGEKASAEVKGPE